MNEEKVNKLIGRTLLKINDEDDDLHFFLDGDEVITFVASGDCCSHSWIESIESPDKPETIVSFEEIEIPPSSETIETTPTKKEHYEEEMQYYFYKVITDKGSYLIEMRNSSNGCYGGWLE